MIRLLYISTARDACGPDELADILRVSRRNNAAADITGLLIAGGQRFLQILEGPDAAVQTTFDRIRSDPRHFAPVVLSRRAVDERLFGQWAMGFQPAAGVFGVQGIDDAVAALIAPIADPTVKAYFSEFALKHAA